MENIELNLTRKWRSKNFQEVIGQPLAIRILQNSLYLKQFFPVYLFAGQRGCGKTSTARIFAAAVNCARLSEFQIDPKKIALPCLQCESCIAMTKFQHPDFIEIDAASHTGVDNIRNIIDSSSFLPLLSHKKIYLIDEAHMLSKAAFNAFLKILEEPPMSVIFILATTDMQKILDTVKSRCFQIFFDPVEHQVIHDHLEKICIAESINYDEQGLAVIARQADGSVRDAINILEQVRFATKKVSKDAVLSILGHIDESTLLVMLDKIVAADVHDLLLFCSSLEKYEISIEYIWGQLTELVYDAILIKYTLEPRQFINLSSVQKNMIDRTDITIFTSLFEMLCLQEQHLAKTTKKLRFLEMMLLLHISQDQTQVAKKKNKSFVDGDATEKNKTTTQVAGPQERWQQFVNHTKSFDDLVLMTMFSEAKFIEFDGTSCSLKVSFLKKFTIFQDRLDVDKKSWHQVLQNIFGHQVQFTYNFEHVSENIKPMIAQERTFHKVSSDYQSSSRPVGNKLDISDTNRWKLANQLIKHFDGIITEISGDMYD